MDKNTKTYNWTNSRGDKLVYTVQLGYLLDASGNDKVNHGWLKALDKNHIQYVNDSKKIEEMSAMGDK